MINDRGNIKWTAMMLPEHAKMLEEMWSQEEWKEKPSLSEEQQTEINLKLQLALHNNLKIELEYFKKHEYHKVKGKLSSIDTLTNTVQMEETVIPLDSLTDAWID